MPSSKVMSEFKAGTLKSGSPSGPTVSNPKQAVAIMLSEKSKEGTGTSLSGGKRGPKTTTRLMDSGVKKFKKYSPKK